MNADAVLCGRNLIANPALATERMLEMRILNHRLTRIAVGILLLMLAAVALLPGLTGFTSLDGTVNSRLAVINAPIDGEVCGIAAADRDAGKRG